MNFGENTGIEYVGIRVGINSGEVQIKENDIYGLNVNLTSRIQHSIPLEGIWVSNSVKRDYEKTFGVASGVMFRKKKRTLKSFGEEELWSVRTPSWLEAIKRQREVRQKLLGTLRVPSWII